jgi:tetratricopeptide (TPR) repeat protein
MTSLTNILAVIDEARTRHDAKEMVAIFKKFESIELPPAYLVTKARAIQLSDGAEYTLDVAERCLQQAISLDKNCLEAYVELGYLYDAVYDAPSRGLDVFNQGLEIATSFVAEFDLGRAKALLQIGRVEDALIILNENKYHGVKPFDVLRNEILE